MARTPPKSKIYTRGGDRGKTSLFGGRRVSKDHQRVTAYGTIDELNSDLGVAISFIRQRRLAATLEGIQYELFNIGAELASDQPVRRGRTSAERTGAVFHFEAEPTERLESLIDEYDARVPPLKTFVLPGGSTAASLLHQARTVCRRAERELVTLARKERVNPAILAYVNRLCDLLFVLARYLNKAARRREVLWQSS